MQIAENSDVPPDLPVRKSVRRLRWFRSSFQEQVKRITAETGNRFDVDNAKLSAVFVEWLRAFEAQKPDADTDRLPYVGFAAGLMLKSLIKNAPAQAVEMPEGADRSNPAYFWPEGYLYVAYCLNVRALVLEQDFHEKQAVVPELAEMRTWWSFKENVEEDPALAVAFLDVFAGEEPQWTMPDTFRRGQLNRLASRFYTPIDEDGS